MTTTKTNVHSDEFLARMAELMAYAAESGEGLKALAAAIAPPIDMEIKRREITSLLLTKHKLPPGEPAKYQKRPKLKAYWISKDGDAVESGILEDEVEFPIHRIHSMPMVDVSVLKHGNVGTMIDIQKAAADEIRKAIDKRTVTVLSAAVPPERVVTCSGGKITDTAMNQAFSLIEDLELTVKTVLMRAPRMNDMRGWNLDPQTARELIQKGFLKIYNGADLVVSSQMPLDEIVLIPDDEVGKFAIRQDLSTDTINEPKRFRTGWLAWMEAAHGITRPDLLAKIVITP
jgi:hypothetical protein